jgi:hypothetical protein
MKITNSEVRRSLSKHAHLNCGVDHEGARPGTSLVLRARPCPHRPKAQPSRPQQDRESVHRRSPGTCGSSRVCHNCWSGPWGYRSEQRVVRLEIYH